MLFRSIFHDHQILGLAHFINVVAVSAALGEEGVRRVEAVVGGDEGVAVDRAGVSAYVRQEIARDRGTETQEIVRVSYGIGAQVGNGVGRGSSVFAALRRDTRIKGRDGTVVFGPLVTLLHA